MDKLDRSFHIELGIATQRTNNLLIRDILLSGRCRESAAEIVYRDLKRYDYAVLISRVKQLANVLVGIGVEEGDKIAVLDWDSHRYLECMFAVPMMGAIFHPVNMRLAPNVIVETILLAEDDYLLIHRDFEFLLPMLQSAGRQFRGIIWLESELSTLEAEKNIFGDYIFGDYEQLLAGAALEYQFPELSEQTIAAISFTKGTTGTPKGCYFSHRQLVLHTMSVLTALSAFEGGVAFRSDDVYMPFSPIFHGFGWAVPMAITMLGAKQVFCGNAGVKEKLHLYQTEQVTFSGGEPQGLHYCLTTAQQLSIDLSGWKVMISGERLREDVAEVALNAGVEVGSAWGITETGPLMCLSYLSREVRAGSLQEQMQYRLKAGMPSPLVDIRVVDESSNTVAYDGVTVGEVIVRAPWAATKFVHAKQELLRGWRDGWYFTGDAATVDELGYIQIQGRIDEGIRPEGHWVSCLELENLLSGLEGVAEVAVIGFSDISGEQRPCALVVPQAGKSISLQHIRKHMKPYIEQGSIGIWSVPAKVIEIAEIPHTVSGTVDRSALYSRVKKDKLLENPF